LIGFQRQFPDSAAAAEAAINIEAIMNEAV
jgi:hypothetical protein